MWQFKKNIYFNELLLIFSVVLAFGVKESSLFNNVFTGLNLVVVVFVVIAGSFYGKCEKLKRIWYVNSVEYIFN